MEARRSGLYARMLRTYVAPRWRLAGLLMVLLLANVAAQLAGPQILRSFIDSLAQDQSQQARFKPGC